MAGRWKTRLVRRWATQGDGLLALSYLPQDVEWKVLEGAVHVSASDVPMIFPQV